MANNILNYKDYYKLSDHLITKCLLKDNALKFNIIMNEKAVKDFNGRH